MSEWTMLKIINAKRDKKLGGIKTDEKPHEEQM